MENVAMQFLRTARAWSSAHHRLSACGGLLISWCFAGRRVWVGVSGKVVSKGRERRGPNYLTNGPVEVTLASEGLGAGFDILMIGMRRGS